MRPWSVRQVLAGLHLYLPMLEDERGMAGMANMIGEQKMGDLFPRRKPCPVCGWGDNRHHPECNYPGSVAYRWGAISYALREFGRTVRKAVWK